MQPRVVDISHHNTVVDLHATAAAGVWGVIHKATQGAGYRDPTYAQRRQPAADAGMLWGAYHFGDNSDPAAQVASFLNYAQPGNDTLLVLDYEDHPSGKSRTMRPTQMVAFLREIERRTGRKAALYSGNRIKEDIHALSIPDRAYVCEHPLWLCQYGPKPSLPMGFTRSFLWQYTDGQVGPQPHGIPGIKGLVDLNVFNGTREDLESVWIAPFGTAPEANADTEFSSQSRRGSDDDSADDAPVKPARGSDDTGLPPFMQVPARATGGLNVRVPTARYDITVEVVQRELDAMGYHEVGDIDGKWGGKTAAGIKAFFVDRGVDAAAELGPLLNNEIAKAKVSGFSRPIAPDRANARPKDLAPRVEAVRVSLWGRFSAKVAAGAAGLGLTGSSLSGTFQTVRDKLQPVEDVFNHIPGSVWFLLMLAVAGAVWYATSRTATAVTKDYNTGRLN
jgi:lysozyme